MSLVAYGDSDCESDEDVPVTSAGGPAPSDGVRTESKVNGFKPFLSLPQPKSVGLEKSLPDDEEEEKPAVVRSSVPPTVIQETKDECPLFPTLPKPKAGGKVRITIPSLNEFYDEDDDYQPKRKMIRPSKSGCGLFSMLPDPKNKKTSMITTNTTMVPRATMRKAPVVKEKSKPPQPLEIKLFESKPVEVEEDVADEDDQEDVDFLGLNKINDMPDVEPVSGFDLPEIQTSTAVIEDDRVYGPVYCPEEGKSDLYEDDDTKLTLDSNALKQLGDRDKTHIKQVDVINVNMSQVLEESQQWLQKNMTEEYAESKNVGSDINITGQSKRKHQITYLAQQAKANELKLKNMWAENRMTRKQTQAKYGF